MSGTGVISGLAVIVPAAFVDAVAMNQVRLVNRAFPVVLGIATHITTGLRWHGDKPMPLATCFAGAGVVGCLAVIVSATFVDALTMDQVCLGSAGRGGRVCGVSAEHACCSDGQCDTER